MIDHIKETEYIWHGVIVRKKPLGAYMKERVVHDKLQHSVPQYIDVLHIMIEF